MCVATKNTVVVTEGALKWTWEVGKMSDSISKMDEILAI